MGTIHICFVLSFSVAGSELPDTIEELYQKKYKKILSFLYAHQDMCITLFVPGIVLEWIEKKTSGNNFGMFGNDKPQTN